MVDLRNSSTSPGSGGGGAPLPQMQLQPQTPTSPSQLPYQEPPPPRTPVNLKLAPPNFSLPPVPDILTNPATRTAASATFTLIQRGPAPPTPVTAVLKAGVAAVQAGWTLGQYIDDQNQPNYSSAPMPSSYGKPQPLGDPDPGIVGYTVGGVYLRDDGSEYAFGAETGPRPSVFVSSQPHPSGGSNGTGAVLDLDEKGAVLVGQAFYRTNCQQSLCGVKGYRIDLLIPKYADGTVGKNQAKPTPKYTTDPNYTGDLTAPTAKPASQPQTTTPSNQPLKPGQKLDPGQKKSSPPSSIPQTVPKTPPRPDLTKLPDPGPAPVPIPLPAPLPTGFPAPKTTNLTPPAPAPNFTKAPLPSGSPSPSGAPKAFPSPVGSPSLQPDPCEPNPCMSSMYNTNSQMWDMLQYLLGLFEDNQEKVNVILCDCVDGSPVYASKELSVLKGTRETCILQFYEIATTKGLICLGSTTITTAGKSTPAVEEIEVPVIQCENGAPVSYKLKIPVAKGSELKTYMYFNELAEIRKHECLFATAVGTDLAAIKLQNDATGKAIGVDEYPASLPPSLISKDQGWLGNLIPDANIEIPNLTRLLSQFIKYFDEILGQWEIPIEVKDSDPATPGDQPIGFKIPNLAEGFAEMFGLLLQSSSNLELLVNMQTRTLIEVGQDKQQNFISYKLLQALVDYINFDYKEVGTELPMMFKPGEDEVDKMLVETMTKVTVAEFDDKIDFQRHLLVLLEMAKMWKAQNFKKLDLGTGMKQQIIDRIKALGQQSEELSVEKKDADGKDQFDRFCEDVETQFAATPGILDAAHPYGGDFEDRPRIKKLGQ